MSSRDWSPFPTASELEEKYENYSQLEAKSNQCQNPKPPEEKKQLEDRNIKEKSLDIRPVNSPPALLYDF